MKRSFRLILAAAVLVSLAACDAFRTLSDRNANTSLGKPYELIVVCAPQQWDGPVGETLRGLLGAPVEYVNQIEPSFDLLRILPRGFTNMATRHRNILKVEIDPSVPEERTSITAEYDWRAAPQIVLTLKGPRTPRCCNTSPLTAGNSSTCSKRPSATAPSTTPPDTAKNTSRRRSKRLSAYG